jgi:hypothetical protein
MSPGRDEFTTEVAETDSERKEKRQAASATTSTTKGSGFSDGVAACADLRDDSLGCRKRHEGSTIQKEKC